jgi:hypothetical protein
VVRRLTGVSERKESRITGNIALGEDREFPLLIWLFAGERPLLKLLLLLLLLLTGELPWLLPPLRGVLPLLMLLV